MKCKFNQYSYGSSQFCIFYSIFKSYHGKNGLLLPAECTQPSPVDNLKADLSLILTNTYKCLPEHSDRSHLSFEAIEIALNRRTGLVY